ncbi:MAG TPA: SDR family NAD(P)-dependent oxidoreductase, partial [Puia sp.]
MDDFNKQVAIVTGAASGIGLAIAHKLLAKGALVVVFDLNSKGLDEEFERYGERARLVAIDVSDQALVEKAIQDV